MLDLPKTLIVTAYRCEKCDTVFFLEQDPQSVMVCPRVYPGDLCAGKAYAIEDINLAVKNPKGSKQPSWDNSKIDYNQ